MRMVLSAVLMLCALPAIAARGGTDLGEDPAFEHAKGDDLEVAGVVNFFVGRAELSPRAKGILGKLAVQLAANAEQKLELAGHTDSSGAEHLNAALSEQRARSVGKFLAAHGVAESRLSMIGYGPFQPVASNDTEAGRARNRRVEVKISR